MGLDSSITTSTHHRHHQTTEANQVTLAQGSLWGTQQLTEELSIFYPSWPWYGGLADSTSAPEFLL